ncbi:cyclase family protein [Terasakiella sp.]|uniref:cyclase family protein n=1 Tax=Terasakiella sp. TaxID=2034861 RepID=UPI003AA9A3DB
MGKKTLKIYDITVPFSENLPVWPGDPRPKVARFMNMDQGDAANVTGLEMCVHTGTHVDAPVHFVKNGSGVDQLDLNICVGLCEVVDLPDVMEITRRDVDGLDLPEGCSRLLFKTRNSQAWVNPAHTFIEDFVAFSPDGAQAIVDRGIKLVGVDYLSVQKFSDLEPTTHQILLGAGVVALEGIDLREIDAGSYMLHCLPMKIVGSDGAPARVILSRDE